MDQALYVAMNGASQLLKGQTVHLNNLANANTSGFKADFERISTYELPQAGALDAVVYSEMQEPGSNLNPGALIQTGNDLDVAIDGDGWLAVQLPEGGEAYSRAGTLHVDGTGVLRTAQNYEVLGNGGPIALPPFENLEVSVDGTISIRPAGSPENSLASIDRLKLVNPDASEIAKGDDGLFHAQENKPFEADASVKVRQGSIEGSNVNAVDEMTNIISIAREFEIELKLMEQVEHNEQQASSLLNMS